MKELYNALPIPDDRPITAICVIEDVNKCPYGYRVVAKTHDQDLDADLGKDGFFGKRMTRYLCLSKTEGPPGFVIDSLCIVNEKDQAPNGFVLLSKTYGTEQRAWRKRQVCYRLSETSSVFLAITDIIILSKAKKAPNGFTLAGEVNGLLICYKSAPLTSNKTTTVESTVSSLPVINLKPTSPMPNIDASRSSNSPAMYPSSPLASPTRAPVRPAPLPPATKPKSPELDKPDRTVIVSSGTLSGFSGLEGVPFTFGPMIQSSGSRTSRSMDLARIKTAQEVLSEYQYSFAAEREATLRL